MASGSGGSRKGGKGTTLRSRTGSVSKTDAEHYAGGSGCSVLRNEKGVDY